MGGRHTRVGPALMEENVVVMQQKRSPYSYGEQGVVIFFSIAEPVRSPQIDPATPFYAPGISQSQEVTNKREGYES